MSTKNTKNHLPGIYRLNRPLAGSRVVPVVFDSPHSGRVYPPDFGYSCEFETLRRGEDNEVDTLFAASVPAHGGIFLAAEFPRTYIDVNRAIDDIDPEILATPWPERTRPGPRSAAGIGLIRRLLKPGLPVYNRKLDVNTIRQRIDQYYKPYHSTLELVLDQTHDLFGQVWHIDIHSMPMQQYGGAPDFVLGDLDGTSCDREFVTGAAAFLRGQGYKVSLNHPYKGAELLRRYSDPQRGRHSLQIEIAKPLYWDERKLKKNMNYNLLKENIDKFVEFIAGYAADRQTSLAAD